MSYEDCIDVVQEWVGEQGFLTTSFVNRGDPAAPDYSWTNFTRDGAWHDLDLSGIVPAGVVAVSLFSQISDSLINRVFWLRKKGNVNEEAISRSYTQVSGIRICKDFVVPVDSDRKIQYLSTIQNLQRCDLTVKGWWL